MLHHVQPQIGNLHFIGLFVVFSCLLSVSLSLSSFSPAVVGSVFGKVGKI